MSQTVSRTTDQKKALIADESAVGERLDAFTAAQMPSHVSRSRVKFLIKGGNVFVDGKMCQEPNLRLKGGERIELEIPEPEDAAPIAQDIPLNVLFEDEHLIVVNKPTGMVVHPAVGNWSGTLVNALLFHCGSSLAGIGGVRRPGIVHRLDKDTSGVMVVAKTEIAHAGLTAQFADHGKSGPLERNYLALVWGQLPRNEGKVDLPLGRSNSNRVKRAVVKPGTAGARHAVTHYSVLKVFGDASKGDAAVSLVECRLETGRTHQIRVHMAEIGHPLVGDLVYGAAFQTKVNRLDDPARVLAEKFKHQALHAAILGFEHPATGEHMRFQSPPPGNFAKLLNTLEKSR